MEQMVDPTVQQLLDELTERSYLARQKQIVHLLEPNSDIAIPILIERLEGKGENYHVRDNALDVLALSADPRAILPVIRYIEIKTGWTKHVFDHLRQGLMEKNRTIQKGVNGQLIKYLEDGPNIPVPEPFDPVKSQNDFMKVVSALMKRTGVTELDEESTELVEELKERFSKPLDLSESEKSKIPEYQNILVEVIDTLSEFGGLQDDRLVSLLSTYINEYGFDSIAAQHALTALSKIDPQIAIARLKDLRIASQAKPDTSIKRVVTNKPDGDEESFNFTVCVREPSDPQWKERPYYFRVENRLVYFLARGDEAYRWFVGRSSNHNTAFQLAIEYLEHWIQNIDSQNVKKTQTGKYSRIYAANRYSETIHALQKYINFEKWGFHQTHISEIYEHPSERPQIIYDSEWCRVKFMVRSYGEMYNQSDVLRIEYGRLHASDKESTMLWKGEMHYCWHHVSLALCFLDDVEVDDAAKVMWDYPKMQKYKILDVPQPEQEAEKHGAIWERYGQRLFELFDLRHPDFWDDFSLFVKKAYTSKGIRYHAYGTPHEKIC